MFKFVIVLIFLIYCFVKLKLNSRKYLNVLKKAQIEFAGNNVKLSSKEAVKYIVELNESNYMGYDDWTLLSNNMLLALNMQHKISSVGFPFNRNVDEDFWIVDCNDSKDKGRRFFVKKIKAPKNEKLNNQAYFVGAWEESYKEDFIFEDGRAYCIPMRLANKPQLEHEMRRLGRSEDEIAKFLGIQIEESDFYKEHLCNVL